MFFRALTVNFERGNICVESVAGKNMNNYLSASADLLFVALFLQNIGIKEGAAGDTDKGGIAE